jgi:chromosome partitioning protein
LTELLLGESSLAQALRRCDEGYDVIPGNIDLTAAEIQLMDLPQREMRLKQALHPVRDNYDFILIDCPPSLSLLTLNALAAADGIIVPMQCEYFALEGLSSLINTVNALKQKLNPELAIDGIIRTMYDVRNNLGNAVSNELTQHFGDTVFRTLVPRNVRLAEAPSHGMSIIRYDKSSRGALAYMGLAGEIIRRNSQKNKEAR